MIAVARWMKAGRLRARWGGRMVEQSARMSQREWSQKLLSAAVRTARSASRRVVKIWWLGGRDASGRGDTLQED